MMSNQFKHQSFLKEILTSGEEGIDSKFLSTKYVCQCLFYMVINSYIYCLRRYYKGNLAKQNESTQIHSISSKDKTTKNISLEHLFSSTEQMINNVVDQDYPVYQLDQLSSSPKETRQIYQSIQGIPLTFILASNSTVLDID